MDNKRWLVPFLAIILATGVNGGILDTLGNFVATYYRTSSSRNVIQDTLNEETFMSTPQLINFHGYTVEEHQVTTKDGYILTLFRIPRGKNQSENNAKKEPVLIYHGFLLSSNDWLLLPFPEDNLPYLLANDGHDIWLGNMRGNNYSMYKTVAGMTSDDPKYYDFGIDELALLDIPAVVSYMLNVTNSSQISYVGQSLGSTIITFALSARPELNNVFKKITLMAPAMYSPNTRSLLAVLNSVPGPILLGFSNLFGGGRIIPAKLNYFLKANAPFICNGKIGLELCDNIIFLISGFNKEQMANRTASLVLGHTPSETSTKIAVHATQINKALRTQMFDYGTTENLRRYGDVKPTAYDLSKVTVPVQGIYGLNDLIVPPKDALKGLGELGNVVETIKVNHPSWTHLDFLYAKDAKRYVYNDVIRFLSN